MGTAVDDIGHGHGKHLGVGTAKVVVQRLPKSCRSCLGVGHGDGKNGIGAELGLCGGVVEGQHGAIDRELVSGIKAEQDMADLAVDVLDRLLYPFS